MAAHFSSWGLTKPKYQTATPAVTANAVVVRGSARHELPFENAFSRKEKANKPAIPRAIKTERTRGTGMVKKAANAVQAPSKIQPITQITRQVFEKAFRKK